MSETGQPPPWKGLGPKPPLPSPALIQALSDEDWRVGDAAVRALIAIGPASVPPLLDAFEEVPEARQEIVEALSRIHPKTPETMAIFREAAQDEDILVRQVATEALERATSQ